MIAELDCVALLTDLSEYGLVAGDVGAVVMVHDGGQAYTIEFVTLTGRTVAIETLDAAQVRAVLPDEIAHARRMASN